MVGANSLIPPRSASKKALANQRSSERHGTSPKGAKVVESEHTKSDSNVLDYLADEKNKTANKDILAKTLASTKYGVPRRISSPTKQPTSGSTESAVRQTPNKKSPGVVRKAKNSIRSSNKTSPKKKSG